MPKIAEIIDPAFKTGTSAKTGAAWLMMKIRVDSGEMATIFAPAAVGDEVELKYSEQFKNYSASKPKRGGFAPAVDTSEIINKLDEILSILKADKPKAAAVNDKDINIDDIPL